MKNSTRKTWKEKLEKDMQPRLVAVPEKWARCIGHGKMLVPSPLLIDAVIKKIPKGKLVTVNTIRDQLAAKYKADMTCPLTTGIFMNIAANAAEDERAKGKTKISPWWRVLKEGGKLNPKFPGGTAQQAKLLKQEGAAIIKSRSGLQFYVKDYETKLADLF